MYIYHYSNEKHPVLLTRRKQGIDPPKNASVGGNYVDHISFFFDPIPSKTIASIYGSFHPVWRKGNTLVEHVINVATLDKDIMFHVVESINKTKLFDEFVEENNWVYDDPVLLEKWKILENKNTVKWGEIGKGLKLLEIQVKKNKGITELAYINASRRNDFEENKMKYAANVPHLMLYPKQGEIVVDHFNLVTIGNEKRTVLAEG